MAKDNHKGLSLRNPAGLRDGSRVCGLHGSAGAAREPLFCMEGNQTRIPQSLRPVGIDAANDGGNAGFMIS